MEAQDVSNQQPVTGTELKQLDPVDRLKLYLNRNEKPTTESEAEESDEPQGDSAFVEEEEQEQPERVEEESEDEPEDNEETGLPPEFYAKTVKAVVNGEELEITVEEAAKGYQRLQDYTRKSQEVARVRQDMVGTLEEYKQGIAVIAQFMTQDMNAYSKIDWEALKASDPNQFAVKKFEAQEAQQRLNLLKQSWQEATARQAKAHTDSLAETVATEAVKLRTALPEWNDPVKGQDFKKAVMKFAVDNGFTPQEVTAVIDHRYLVMLNKARMYDELMKKQAKLPGKKVAVPGKVVKAGERPLPGPKDLVVKAAERLAKDKSVNAAADYIKAKWAQPNKRS